MKRIFLIALIGSGFLLIQSCGKKSEVCECTDHATAMMKGDRQADYDGTFPKNYIKENKAMEDKCKKLFGNQKDQKSKDKMRTEMRTCDGYAEFQDETIKSLEHLKKIYPEMAPEIDQSIEDVKKN